MVTTGPISLGGTATSGGLNQSVNVELGRSGTATINMNESAVRTLAGVASGAISMNNFYGKSNAFTFNRTISTNTQNYNLLNDMVANGYTNGSAYVANITVNSGIYVWSDSTSLAGFATGSITGSGTINLTNNGFIMGRGGDGAISVGQQNLPGNPGGPAMDIQRNINITNNSFIAGGGGGGGFCFVAGGGGGAGGGSGARFSNQPVVAGGAVGQTGATLSGSGSAGGGGGRILPGTGGGGRTGTACGTNLPGFGGGSGGGGGAYSLLLGPCGGPNRLKNSGAGGGGGGWGAAAGATVNFGDCSIGTGCTVGVPTSGAGGSAGGVGVAGALSTGAGGSAAGGTGGRAINLNGNSVTYITTGTIYGAVS